MALVTLLAYEQSLPSIIKRIPFYDSIGHFGLFGMLGYFAYLAMYRRAVKIFGRCVPIGPALVGVYAIMDEALQVFSSSRVFDLGDLLSGLLGIVTLVFFDWLLRNRRKYTYKEFFSELMWFTLKQAKSCMFAGSFLFLIFISKYLTVPGLYRYDVLFLAAVVIQLIMLACKWESVDEAKNIVLFHIVGLVLELYKTSPMIGSWTYPEMGYLKIMAVPLYSGFMYASIGSYIAQAWKNMKLRVVHEPPYWLSILLCGMIYLNFFTNHFIYDVRIFLIVAVFIVYFKADVYFTAYKREFHMPLPLSFLLIAIFVWLGENIGTFYGAWQYPQQIEIWKVVSLQKITSWFLLVIVSFIIVTYLKHYKYKRRS